MGYEFSWKVVFYLHKIFQHKRKNIFSLNGQNVLISEWHQRMFIESFEAELLRYQRLFWKWFYQFERDIYFALSSHIKCVNFSLEFQIGTYPRVLKIQRFWPKCDRPILAHSHGWTSEASKNKKYLPDFTENGLIWRKIYWRFC